MSACPFEERVAAYASGEPDEELAAHLPGCAHCRGELEAARATLRALAPLVDDARSPRRADAEGELFWTDFTRGVRAGIAAAPAQSSPRRLWLAAPAMLAAAAAVWLAVGARLGQVGPGAPLAPAAPVQVAVRSDGASLDPADVTNGFAASLAPDPSPEAELGALDDDELEQVGPALVASLSAPARPTLDDDEADALDPWADPFEALDELDDDALDDVGATL